MAEGKVERCIFCGKPVNAVAADPGEWPLCFCHPDGTGVCRTHHVRCVVARLFPAHAPSEAGGETPEFRCYLCGALTQFGPCDETVKHVMPCKCCSNVTEALSAPSLGAAGREKEQEKCPLCDNSEYERGVREGLEKAAKMCDKNAEDCVMQVSYEIIKRTAASIRQIK